MFSSLHFNEVAIKAPLMNAICERFVGSVRHECLDHLLIFGERQLYQVIQVYVEYFNRSRPHQGIEQHVPCGPLVDSIESAAGKIIQHITFGERAEALEWANIKD